MTFSLIVATLGRVAELDRLLDSLDSQSLKDFEVIVIDQNPDDRLLPVLQRHPALAITHVRAEPGGSHARNLGIRAASGTLIAFPDDDCWYPENLLMQLHAWFAQHPEYCGVFARLRDVDNDPVGPKWPAESCTCNKYNLWQVALTPNGFLRRSSVEQVGFFDERIGVGARSQYQSGEDIDYFLRVLENGGKLWCEASFTVHHPSYHDPERLRRTTYGYALGGGYVLRIHDYPIRYFFSQMLRSVGGAAVSLFRLDLENARVYLLRAAGQIRGYFWGYRDLAGARQSATAK